jgi:pimeloyl-ACP methyl ester carboxylesterase
MADQTPLAIQAQGSFAVGGTVVRHPGIYDATKSGPEGQTLHGDHAHVFYQVPVVARPLPLVFLHGNAQFTKTWETTPDGREGYQTLFLRRGFPVYLIDQPRRGNAGQSTLPMTLSATPDDQWNFNIFRVGIWPDYFDGVQFARDAETLNQYFRQGTPNTGPFDLQVVTDAVVALFTKIGATTASVTTCRSNGPGVLITHSQGGGVGWLTAIRSRQVRAIVSYEPGSNYVFAQGEVPEPMPSAAGALEALGVPLSDFMLLTKIPIVLYYGDNIPQLPVANPGQDAWRVRLQMARLWADAVNRHGGDVTLVHLPTIGIHGNTHFPFSDLNNLQLADLMAEFLKSRQLD